MGKPCLAASLESRDGPASTCPSSRSLPQYSTTFPSAYAQLTPSDVYHPPSFLASSSASSSGSLRQLFIQSPLPSSSSNFLSPVTFSALTNNSADFCPSPATGSLHRWSQHKPPLITDYTFFVNLSLPPPHLKPPNSHFKVLPSSHLHLTLPRLSHPILSLFLNCQFLRNLASVFQARVATCSLVLWERRKL